MRTRTKGPRGNGRKGKAKKADTYVPNTEAKKKPNKAPMDLEEINVNAALYEDAPEWYCRQAYRFCLLGLTNPEIAKGLGIGEHTFNMWRRRYPEFRAAIWEGRIGADAQVVESLFKKAVGYSHLEEEIKVVKGQIVRVPVVKKYPPDTAALCFWLKNRTRYNLLPWLEIARTEVTGRDGGPVQVSNGPQLEQLDLSDLSDVELELLEKMGLKSLPAAQTAQDAGGNGGNGGDPVGMIGDRADGPVPGQEFAGGKDPIPGLARVEKLTKKPLPGGSVVEELEISGQTVDGQGIEGDSGGVGELENGLEKTSPGGKKKKRSRKKKPVCKESLLMVKGL